MKTYTAKTLEDVLKIVCEQNNCKTSDIVYNVVEEKKHLLGIGNSVTIEAYTPKDVKDYIFDYLGNFFTEIKVPVEIEISSEIDNKDNKALYKVTFNSENNAVLIGKEGRTLRAISHILKTAVNNTFKTRINVICEVGDYKEKRYKKLTAMANRIGKEVMRTHNEVVLDPLPADERKVIHQALTNFKKLSTGSVGEGKNRHIVVKYIGDE